jgi:sugar lactone lactonase YvrE
MSKQPRITVAQLERVGADLHRPECVVAGADGEVFVPDWRGGVTRIADNGAQETWLATDPAIELRPNGIAVMDDGSFLLANLGDRGGVWRLDHQGALTPWLVEVDGVALPPANFVTVDSQGRTWITVSTRCLPRQLAWRADVADGFVVLVDERGARIVADGLHYTNECRPDPSGNWLYVVETFGRRLARFPITHGGRLKSPEIVLTLGHGSWPDGFAFDQQGGVWLTSLISNRLMRFDGETLHTIVEEANTAHVDAVEEAFARGEMRAEHLGPVPGTRLQHVTSVAFGGADLRTAYVGCLHTDCIFRFRSEIPGVAPPHWNFPLP